MNQNSLKTNHTDSLNIQQETWGTLYEPPSVSFTFETIGWELLVGIVLMVLLTLTWFKIRQYKRNAYRRAALKRLKQYQQGTWNVQDILLLLKKSAMYAYGRRRTGSLYGHDWLKFLDGSAKNVHLLKLEKEISAAIYQNQPLSDKASHELISNARNWIRTHA